ncbi:hypothetical protein BYT27DRAFT_7182508 [Phlegmacium glaucopus]|nr:hypothetical protein BYT27DRAFT_7182508 [Phlegmacium glaucopus]
MPVGIAAESTASSPCSNVPIHCPICPKANPAIKYERLWKLSNKKSKIPPLVISESHRARIQISSLAMLAKHIRVGLLHQRRTRLLSLKKLTSTKKRWPKIQRVAISGAEVKTWMVW